MLITGMEGRGSGWRSGGFSARFVHWVILVRRLKSFRRNGTGGVCRRLS